MKYSSRSTKTKAVCTCGWTYPEVTGHEGHSRLLASVTSHVRYNGAGHTVTKLHQIVTVYKRIGRPRKDKRQRPERRVEGKGGEE